ncbi:MAG TPA: hypothetical protein DF613_15260 [Lachnospiraceae bacterium]|nr:hypothetical protein [Lachnospiraceae bacterium]
MKLRTKLMLGTQLLLAAALVLCCFLMVRSLRRTLIADAVNYTATEHKTLEAAVRKVFAEKSDETISDLVWRAALNYQVKQANVAADVSTQYVLQTETDNVFNNCGINAWQVLMTTDTMKQTGERENDNQRYTVVRHEGRDYCVMGTVENFKEEKYLFATARDITHNMDYVRDLTIYYVVVGLLILVAATVLEAVFLYGMLRPIGRLENGARLIAQGEYGNRIEIKGKDEIGRLADSFNQMAAAVECHVSDLEQVAEERKLLLTALAHEMRTPVTAITGYAYALRYGKLTGEQQQEALDFVDEQSRRLERLSDKLTRVITAQGEIECVTINSKDFFALLRRTLQPLAADHQIRLVLEEDGEEFSGDMDLLVSLASNLYDNARKAGASRVDITFREGCFAVRDNGCGMAPEELDKVTQPFYKIDRSRNREGFGLGLALCQNIAQLHGSSLAIRSTPGEGTEFSMKLSGG